MHNSTWIARTSLATLCVLVATALAMLSTSPTAEAQLSPEFGLAAAIVAPLEPERKTRRAGGRRARDADGDGLSDWFELRRARTNPRRRDTDRDRLTDWTEVKRTRTDPRRRDTDRDGISDWHELRRTKTNPRNADSDGDGSRDRDELRAGSNPRDPASVPFPVAAAPPLFPAPLPTPAPAPGGGSGEPTEPPPPPPDTTPPGVQVTSGPDGLTNDASPTFGFNAEAGAAVVCSIDEGTADFGPCSGAGSHGSAEPLADGAHTFRVRATNAAGKQAVATRGFSVDATEPETQIDSGPPSPTDNHSASFEFSGADPGGSGVASFECRVDSEEIGDWTPCSSPHELADLNDGQHSFEVRAIDEADNVDASPAVHEWAVDTTPPAVQVTSGPDGLTNNASP
ncbi:MAG TPA: Ig-like domain-containing protein, partial [Solirubrobacterales bacterium]|nr:Ig-like domain-containing protein [Solirubrobacterales bacterium]